MGQTQTARAYFLLLTKENVLKVGSSSDLRGQIGGFSYKPIARQGVSKRVSLTIDVAFSMGSVQSGYKEVFGRTE
jgi:hypothetical protein